MQPVRMARVRPLAALINPTNLVGAETSIRGVSSKRTAPSCQEEATDAAAGKLFTKLCHVQFSCRTDVVHGDMRTYVSHRREKRNEFFPNALPFWTLISWYRWMFGQFDSQLRAFDTRVQRSREAKYEYAARQWEPRFQASTCHKEASGRLGQE